MRSTLSRLAGPGWPRRCKGHLTAASEGVRAGMCRGRAAGRGVILVIVDVHLHHSRVRVALVRPPASRLAEGLVTHVERRPVDADLAVRSGTHTSPRSNRPGGQPLEVAACGRLPRLGLRRGHARRLPRARGRDRGRVRRRDSPRSTGPRRRSARSGCRRRGSRRRPRSTAATCSRSRTPSMSAPAGARTSRARRSSAPCSSRSGRSCSRCRSRGSCTSSRPSPRFPTEPSSATRRSRPTRAASTSSSPFPRNRARTSSCSGRAPSCVADDCPRSAELYASLGFEPVVVEIGEFQKLEGCVTCLSVLVD